MKGRILSVILAILMIVSVLPLTCLGVFAETHSGKCGDNLTWKLDSETGKLVISGKGAMTDYNDQNDVPWFKYKSSVKSVAIIDGVTTIGTRAFIHCDSLTGVTIPDSVTGIGDFAFFKCESLANIKIPDSVTYIGNSAFEYCGSLKSISIPSGVTSIGEETFEFCLFTSITIPNGVVSIGTYSFANNTALKTVIIPDSVTSIDDYAFSNCASIESISIPKSVTYFGYGVFAGCKSLTNITIPNRLKKIPFNAFVGCSSLTSVTIPTSVTTIDNWAFLNCDSIKDVYYSGTEEQWKKISIGDNNETLTNANFHYEYNTTSDNPFTDVPAKSWYTEAALWCNNRGYITGTGDGIFSPNSTLTRAMFVQILAKVDGVSLDGISYSGKFSDVKAKNWFAKAVQWAVDNGVTGGTSATTFSPNDSVTREQLATFFYAYSKSKGYDVTAGEDLVKYTDAGKISSWAFKSIKWAVAVRLISGTSDTTISPKSGATRAQAAVIFKNYVEIYVANQK